MANPRYLFPILLCLLIATAVGTPLVGLVPVQWADVKSLFSDQPGPFWILRVPRLLMAMIAGASLSLAGVTFQAVFRNPLATPYTLGVASGAALAASIAFALGHTGLVVGIPILTLAAFTGAITSVLIVYAVASVRRGFSTGTLLLAGVSIAFICSACILLIEYFSKLSVTNATVKWLMGSVEVAGIDPVLEAIFLAVIGMALIWYLHKDLDLLLMGDLVAASRGVNVRRSRRIAYFAASIVTAAVVAQTGPIGFVGLVVPHVMRFLVGPGHRRLIPASILAGAIFLPVCDTLSRQVMWWIWRETLQIPVGILTNLLGGVFFLGILLTRKQESPIA